MTKVEKALNDLLDEQNAIRGLIGDLKEQHPELQMGYSVSYGGILNAYREMDLTWDEAIAALRTVRETDNSNIDYSIK